MCINLLNLPLARTAFGFILKGLVELHVIPPPSTARDGTFVKSPPQRITVVVGPGIVLLGVGDKGLDLLVGGLLLLLSKGGGGADVGDLLVELGEGRGAPSGPGTENGGHLGDGAGGEVSHGGDAGDLDGLAGGVECSV